MIVSGRRDVSLQALQYIHLLSRLEIIITKPRHFLSLTFNKIEDDSKNVESSTKTPWWSIYTKKPTFRPSTTTPTTTSTTYTTRIALTSITSITSTTRTTTTSARTTSTPPPNRVRFRPVPGIGKAPPRTINTIGKLINVTGELQLTDIIFCFASERFRTENTEQESTALNL